MTGLINTTGLLQVMPRSWKMRITPQAVSNSASAASEIQDATALHRNHSGSKNDASHCTATSSDPLTTLEARMPPTNPKCRLQSRNLLICPPSFFLSSSNAAISLVAKMSLLVAKAGPPLEGAFGAFTLDPGASRELGEERKGGRGLGRRKTCEEGVGADVWLEFQSGDGGWEMGIGGLG